MDNSKGFNVLMLNVRSLYSTIDEINVRFQGYDVIALCETWLNDSHTLEMLHLTNYKMFRLDRTQGNIRNANNRLKRGDGLIIYVHDKYSKYVSVLHDCSKITYNLEQLWIQIDKPNVRKCIIGLVYRPPSTDVTISVKELDLSMDYIQSLSDSEIIVTGDLNVNYNQRDTRGFKILKEFERKYNLSQIITTNTRIVEGSKSLIDLLFTNMTHVKSSGVLKDVISDHLPIFVQKKKDREKQEFEYISDRSYANYDKNVYQRDILENNLWHLFWHTDTSDVELLWEYMLYIITMVADYHCPLRRMKIRKNSPHWMCREIVAEIYQKDFLYRKAVMSGEEHDWRNYRNQNSDVKKLVLNAKEEYIKDQLEQNNNNPRRFW